MKDLALRLGDSIRLDSNVFALGGVLGLLALIVIPIPKVMVDLGLVLSLALGLLILGAALRAKHPLELTTFPALVLTATLLRIGLNVATTRWILSTGDAGSVVRAFGEFAAAGDFFVGFTVWVVITVLLIVVVAKGAERVAEVAARFSLDGMPGRQMSIDADMRAGALSFSDAQRKRGDLQREARLYGAMDGALKFVKGDTIASVAITAVNLIVGMAIGVARDGMSFAESVGHYGLISIGDGLCSQIPSLLTAVAAGIVVTRVTSDRDATEGIVQTLKAELVDGGTRWWEVAGALALLGIVPGLPTIPFLAFAGGCAIFAYSQDRKNVGDSDSDSLLEDSAMISSASENSELTLRRASDETDVIVEVGHAVSEWLGAEEQRSLAAELELVSLLLAERKGIKGAKVGVTLSCSALREDEVRILIAGVEFGRIQISRKVRWYFENQIREGDVVLESFIHPISGASVVALEDSSEPRPSGIELPRRIAIAVIGALWLGGFRLVRIANVQEWLREIDTKYPGTSDAVIPERIQISTLTRVLRELVRSGFNIRDLNEVLNALACAPGGHLDFDQAMVFVREALSGSYLAPHLRRGVLLAWVVPHELVQAMDEELVDGTFDSAWWIRVLQQVETPRGTRMTVLVPRSGRKLIEELVKMASLPFNVVAMEEVPENYETFVIGKVETPNRPSAIAAE